MPAEIVISLARQALITVLLVSAPMLIAGLVTGLVVSLFQATTQINEQTMSFIPKIIVIFISAMLFGPWMINLVTGFGVEMFGNLARYIR